MVILTGIQLVALLDDLAICQLVDKVAFARPCHPHDQNHVGISRFRSIGGHLNNLRNKLRINMVGDCKL
jgi:hypothetical protein